MKLSFAFVEKYYPIFLEGLGYTIRLSLIVIAIASIIGIIVYFMKASKLSILGVRPISVIAKLYIEVMRGMPQLLMLLMAYSGIKMLFGVDVTITTAAVTALSLNSGAYVAEIIRAGVEAVDKGQVEAARSLGMNSFHCARLVVAPQAVKNILPAIANEFVTIIKESSICSVLGMQEIMFNTKLVQGATFRPAEPLIIAAILYFCLTFPTSKVIQHFERRMSRGDVR